MRAPDDDAAAIRLRDGLTALLHWDGLKGLHSSGLAQWQMWILADRSGHLTVERPPAKAATGSRTAKATGSRAAKQGTAKRPAKRTAKAAGGRRRKASGGA